MNPVIKPVIVSLVLGIVFLVNNAMALDARWKFIGTVDEVKFYYDSLTVTYVNKDTVRFWSIQIFPPKETKWSESSYLNEISCTNRTIRFIQAHIKQKDGKSSTTTESSSAINIVPDTMFEEYYYTLCKK
ncbi:MAG: hypothetical protein HQL06_15720 [Nitrospirae bacterium]|nr:hypothetical protein [Nitrospirota bacterium]